MEPLPHPRIAIEGQSAGLCQPADACHLLLARLPMAQSGNDVRQELAAQLRLEVEHAVQRLLNGAAIWEAASERVGQLSEHILYCLARGSVEPATLWIAHVQAFQMVEQKIGERTKASVLSHRPGWALGGPPQAHDL